MQKIIYKKNGFTLVELIITIVILAILGIIAFIALNGYVEKSRDSARKSDLSIMEQSLELFQIDAGKYPKVSEQYNVSYSGATVWTQGVYGDQTRTNVSRISKVPVDPLTGKMYTYSVTNNRQEYQLAGLMETDNIVLNLNEINQVNAAQIEAKAVVTGNYNGVLIKAETGTICNVLSLPSIISSYGKEEKNLENILNNEGLVYNGYKNLPGNYKGTRYKLRGGFHFQPQKLLLHSDSQNCKTLYSDDDTPRLDLINNIRLSYSGTILRNERRINSILAKKSSDQNSLKLAGINIVNNSLGGNLKIRKDLLTSSGATSSGVIDTGPKIPIDTWDIVGTPNIDTLNGTSGANKIAGLESDDMIYAGYGDDLIYAGPGNDYIEGSRGNDTYLFFPGDGNDVVYDNAGSASFSPSDRIKFGPGVTPADVKMYQNASNDNLLIQYTPTDSITINNWVSGGSTTNRIEFVEFDSGIIWSIQDMYANIAASGNYVKGRYGNDTFIFNQGDGADSLIDWPTYDNWSTADKIKFGPGITPGSVVLTQSAANDNLVIQYGTGDVLTVIDWSRSTTWASATQVFRIESIQFNDGTIWDLTGIYDAIATTGNYVTGGNGSQTYTFNLGDGVDSLLEKPNYDNWSTGDKIKFGPGITPDSIIMTQSATNDNLVIDYGTGDTLTVLEWSKQTNGASAKKIRRIEYMEFADGTLWGLTGMYDKIATTGNYVKGSFDNQTYTFNLGDGVDTLIDKTTYDSDSPGDKIKFGAGITPNSVTITQSPSNDNLVIDYGTGDTLTVIDWSRQWSGASAYKITRIEYMEFADGTLWDLTGIYDRIATSSNYLKGGYDNQIYTFNLGDGIDTLIDKPIYDNWSSADKIKFGPGITPDSITMTQSSANDNLVIDYGTGDTLTVLDWSKSTTGASATKLTRIEYMEFSDGTLWGLTGMYDRIATTSNYIKGGNDNQIYTFNLGDGIDTLFDKPGYSSWSSADKILFGPGITQTGITITNSSPNLIIDYGTGDQITILDETTSLSRIESIEFNDGSIISIP